MKAVRIAAIVLASLLVLLAITIGVVASRFDAAWLKQELIRTVSEQKQRTLRLDGDLALSFFPAIGVKLDKASLTERNSAQEFASVDSARIAVQLLPLLSRQVVVERIELSGVRASVFRRQGGGFNFDDLLSKSGEASAPIRFDIAGVRLANSALSYRDENSGTAIDLSDVELDTGHLADVASGPLKLGFKVDAKQHALKAALGLHGTYNYDLEHRQFDIKKLQLDIHGQLQGDSVEAGFEAPDLALSADKVSGQAVSAVFKLSGQRRQFDGRLELSGFEGAASLLQVEKLAAQWSLRQGQFSAQGNLAGALQGNLATRILDLPRLTGEAEFSRPDMPMKRVTLPLLVELHADWGRAAAAGNLSTKLDDSAIRVDWQLSSFSPLAAGVTLAVDRLDIDRYLPAAPAAKTAGEGAPAAGREEPIDLSFMHGLDLKGEVRIGFLRVRNVKFNNLKADIRIQKDRLDVSPLAAALYGGSLGGSLAVQADGNRIAPHQALNNVSVEPLLMDLLQKDAIEGLGQIKTSREAKAMLASSRDAVAGANRTEQIEKKGLGDALKGLFN